MPTSSPTSSNGRLAELDATAKQAAHETVFAKLSDDVRQADREGLVAECVIDGPARRGEKLVPRDRIAGRVRANAQ